MGSLAPLIKQTARDFINLLIPRVGFRESYEFAFLVHPRDEKDMVLRFPFLAKMSPWLLKVVQHHFWPVTVSNITGLRSQKTHSDIQGYVISIPMTATEMLQNRKRAKKQIHKAARLARNKGAKIIGLGALTSSLTRGGLDLLDIPGIAVTTGHAYTGYSVTQTLLLQLKNAGIDLSTAVNCPIAIVGAAGSVGSISAELLAEEGAASLLLIDIDRKSASLDKLKQKLAEKYPGLTVQCSQDMKLLKSACGIITATNTPDALVRNEHVSDGTIVVDDAQPSDISPELLERDKVLVLEAGAVHTPNISANFNMGLVNKDDNFCCLAEVLILASNEHIHNFVINRATLADVAHIREAGEALQFKPSVPQNEHGLVAKEKIHTVSTLLKARCSV